jgi:hypothetical protein
MSESVDHCGHEYFIPDNLVPSVKSRINSDDGRFFSGSARELIKEEFATFFITTGIPKLVTDERVVFFRT